MKLDAIQEQLEWQKLNRFRNKCSVQYLEYEFCGNKNIFGVFGKFMPQKQLKITSEILEIA